MLTSERAQDAVNAAISAPEGGVVSQGPGLMCSDQTCPDRGPNADSERLSSVVTPGTRRRCSLNGGHSRGGHMPAPGDWAAKKDHEFWRCMTNRKVAGLPGSR